ncbi:MAG: ABC transporter permease [Propionibacteriaceae bacterium]|jgi:peptide/nickel transport system permease protein|nr:ABC transporter permease [Propionibacteriaceae bacterium]
MSDVLELSPADALAGPRFDGIGAELDGNDPKRPRFQLPGAQLLATTHGLQRFMLLTGVVIVAIFVIVGAFAPVLAPFGFAQITTFNQPPSAEHLLGTTVGGFDVLSRIIWGARTAIEVILLAVSLSIFVGVTLGVISGFFSGVLDRVLVLFMDALYALPSLLLAIVVSIMVSSGQSGAFSGILSTSISITVVFIPQYFRVTRNATLAAKAEPYVDAARVAGANPGRIMFGHILPNVSQTIPVLMTLNASEAILTLAGLGFLGFGIEPNSAAEWGYDLNKARPDLSSGYWWGSIFPGLAIVLIVTGVTLIGESMNDVLNPLLRTRGGATTADEEELAEVVSAVLDDAPSSDEGLVEANAASVLQEPDPPGLPDLPDLSGSPVVEPADTPSAQEVSSDE